MSLHGLEAVGPSCATKSGRPCPCKRTLEPKGQEPLYHQRQSWFNFSHVQPFQITTPQLCFANLFWHLRVTKEWLYYSIWQLEALCVHCCGVHRWSFASSMPLRIDQRWQNMWCISACICLHQMTCSLLACIEHVPNSGKAGSPYKLRTRQDHLMLDTYSSQCTQHQYLSKHNRANCARYLFCFVKTMLLTPGDPAMTFFLERTRIYNM